MKLMMIADDFTGALDAGAQFAKKGFTTKVVVYYNGFRMEEFPITDILVIDTETRHKSSADAYKIVFELVKAAVEKGVNYIFKKTDSALRGNIGAELTAVLDAAQSLLLHFIPAFPKMNRITQNGIHYIDGKPVDQSVFGMDPFEPVTTAKIPELIHKQCNTMVQVISRGKVPVEAKEKTIAVYDCRSDTEMEMIALKMKEMNGFHIMAGCAGLAEIVPKILKWQGISRVIPPLPEKLLVICGSVNPITTKQLDYAQEHGFVRIQLTIEQKLSPGYFSTDQGKKMLDFIWETCTKNNKVILDTNDLPGGYVTETFAQTHGISKEEIRTRIVMALGKIVENMVERGLECSMLMTGGDTLFGCIQLMDEARLTPIGEFEAGVVLSELISKKKCTHVLTKSGGFGDKTLLTDIANKICGK